MELGDIWVKIANNLRLSQQEQEFLRLEGRNTQMRNTFVAGLSDGSSHIKAASIQADTAEFTYPPYGTAVKVQATQTVVPLGSNVSWSTVLYNDLNMYNASVSATDITIPITGKYYFKVWGSWDANATGVRLAQVIIYGYGTTMEYDQRVAQTSGATSIGFDGEVSLLAGMPVRIKLSQTSGGNLNCFVTFSMRLVKKYDTEIYQT